MDHTVKVFVEMWLFRRSLNKQIFRVKIEILNARRQIFPWLCRGEFLVSLWLTCGCKITQYAVYGVVVVYLPRREKYFTKWVPRANSVEGVKTGWPAGFASVSGLFPRTNANLDLCKSTGQGEVGSRTNGRHRAEARSCIATLILESMINAINEKAPNKEEECLTLMVFGNADPYAALAALAATTGEYNFPPEIDYSLSKDTL